VFAEDGRTTPVFNDKHLSWDWERAKEMAATSHEMGFPMMAGSGLSVSWRLPSADLPFGAQVTESLVIGGGWPDGGSFHMVRLLPHCFHSASVARGCVREISRIMLTGHGGIVIRLSGYLLSCCAMVPCGGPASQIEFTQCLLERRRGGESGVLWVEAMEGDAVLAAMEAGSWDAGGWDPKLFEAALCRSHALQQAVPSYSARFPSAADIRTLWNTPLCFRWQYKDGTRATMLFGNGLVGVRVACSSIISVGVGGQLAESAWLTRQRSCITLVQDYPFAARLAGGEIFSTMCHLPPTPNVHYSACLMHSAERMFVTRKPVWPIERTLVATGVNKAGMVSDGGCYSGNALLQCDAIIVTCRPGRTEMRDVRACVLCINRWR
jgi:hypothetical protein